MAITLQETLRGLFYAPFYLALARGAYEQEGVEVRFVSAPAPGDAARGLFDGSVDVCWGGPMRVMQAYQADPDCDLVSFAEVVTRDPFLLVARMPCDGFSLVDLLALRVATVAEVPTPWMCLQEDLRRAGLDPSRLNRIATRSMAENVESLRHGVVDVVQVFEPFAAELLAEGGFAICYAAASRGPCSYTTFYTRRPLLTERRDELHGMVRAIYRTQKFIAGATGAEIATGIAAYFPAVAPAILAAACDRYLELGIWGRDPVLRRAGYDRLLAGLVSGGLVDPGTPFDVAVDNSLAEAVRAENPPPLV
jgi:NitT/TauT family transport system substrate-binding protein